MSNQTVIADDQIVMRYTTCFLCGALVSWIRVVEGLSIGLCPRCHQRDRWPEVEAILAARAPQG
jgi:hypothetical protein